SAGDKAFRLDRMEPALNQATPGDARDTSSPAAMALTLNALLMNGILPPQHRELLLQWLLECATGASRIPAGAPSGWKVGHKTGSGHHGTANDVGILLPPTGQPIILTLYLTQSTATESTRDEVLAETTRLLCPAAG
ncbi:MAG: serine hydrolase, partial [Desulfovibrio sp.]|uniref:serine hydrolase n=1 Tax=Desulfovibrio sp. TaxID=885 RepID=UPI0039E4C09B